MRRPMCHGHAEWDVADRDDPTHRMHHVLLDEILWARKGDGADLLPFADGQCWCDSR
jgi:hypothetical protein